MLKQLFAAHLLLWFHKTDQCPHLSSAMFENSEVQRETIWMLTRVPIKLSILPRLAGGEGLAFRTNPPALTKYCHGAID